MKSHSVNNHSGEDINLHIDNGALKIESLSSFFKYSVFTYLFLQALVQKVLGITVIAKEINLAY